MEQVRPLFKTARSLQVGDRVYVYFDPEQYTEVIGTVAKVEAEIYQQVDGRPQLVWSDQTHLAVHDTFRVTLLPLHPGDILPPCVRQFKGDRTVSIIVD